MQEIDIQTIQNETLKIIDITQNLLKEVVSHKDNINETKELYQDDLTKYFYFEESLKNTNINTHSKAVQAIVIKALTKSLEINKNIDNTFKIIINSLLKNIKDVEVKIHKLENDRLNICELSEKLKKFINEELIYIHENLIIKEEKKLSNYQEEVLELFRIQDKSLSNGKDKSNKISNKSIIKDLYKLFAGNNINFIIINDINEDENSIQKIQSTVMLSSQDKAMNTFIQKGEVQFDTNEESSGFINKIADVLLNNRNRFLDEFEENFNYKMKKVISSFNDNIKNDLDELIESIEKEIEVSIDIPPIIFDRNGVFSDSKICSKKSKKENIRYRTLNNDEKSYSIVYEVFKENVYDEIKQSFNYLLEAMKYNLQDIFKNRIENTIFNSIESLNAEIEAYKIEMLITLESYKIERINIKKEIEEMEKKQELSKRITKRIDTSKNVLKKLDTKND